MTTENPNAIPLRRDRQQWVFDWMIGETGKVFHFQGDGRGTLPRSVRRHEMISKHLAKSASRIRRAAQAEEAAGHRTTALEYWFEAATAYGYAQHPVFSTNSEKRLLHGLSMDCYRHVQDLTPYSIRHVDIPWGDRHISANLHLLADGRKAPAVISIPGCDQTKEMYPHPLYNHAHQRGAHVISVDGPGQGESNIRGYALTASNYEDAMSAVIDYLVDLPEVDAERIGLYGLSFGSFWALRTAARDPRVRAVAAPWSSIADKRHLMDEESPRWKQLFAYLTQAESEAELDAITQEMTMSGYISRISCPALLSVGEYDPRSPLDEVLGLFDEMNAPRELWIFEDQFHMNTVVRGGAGSAWYWEVHPLSLDWLAARLDDTPLAQEVSVKYVGSSSAGPHSHDVDARRAWYDDPSERGDRES